MDEFDMEFEFDIDDLDVHPVLEFNHDMDIIVEVAPELRHAQTETTRSKSVIIRERDENGSLHYRIEGENSNIVIDAAEGVAIIDGQEVEIDSDSIIVIEETQTIAPNVFKYEVAPDIQWDAQQWKGTLDSVRLAKQLKGNWDHEKWAREWKENFNQEEWAKYWDENKDKWLQYSKEYEVKMKELKSSPEWEQYMEEIKEYKEKLSNQKMEEIILLEKDGAQHEYIIRSKVDGDDMQTDDLELRKREVEVRVLEAQEIEKSKEAEKKGNNGHSSVDGKTLHQYVITTQGDKFKWHSTEGVNIQHISDVKELGYVTLTADVAELNSSSGEVTFTGTGGVVIEVPEDGQASAEEKIERVVLVTSQPLVVDGKLLEVENIEDHILEVKVEGKSKPVDKSLAKVKKAKF
jgi:hypothetical protein